MRTAWLLSLLVLTAACGWDEGPRATYDPPLEGQSPPPPPPPPPAKPQDHPPAPGTAGVDSPAWLRANAPVEWTCPGGWEQEVSTRPTRLVEFTLEKNGPGGQPIQFVLLRGVDEKPGANEINVTRWMANFQYDSPPQQTTSEHDGVKVIKWKVHGRFQGYIAIGTGDPVDEANWTMYCGWIESPAGSLLYKVIGPDAIVKPAEAKVDQLLASMRQRKAQ